jgi:hypothetical protein
MVKRTTPAKKLDERTFAVRIRFAIPETGLSCLGEMHNWLRDNAPNDFAIHSTTVGGWNPQFCGFLYMNSPAVALECVAKFNLQVYGLPKLTP